MTAPPSTPALQTVICADSDRTVVDLSRWMYTYPRPEHVFPVVDWRDGFPVVTASRGLVRLVASQADPTFPMLDVESEALWDAIMLFCRFDFGPDVPTIAAAFRISLLSQPTDPGLLTNLLIFSLVFWKDTVVQARVAIAKAGLSQDLMSAYVDRALESGLVINPALVSG